MNPFLKWAGGKRWFVAAHSKFLPEVQGTYIEPFLGGGSVYFHLKPRRSMLGDKNPELIAVYQGIQADWRGVQRLLRRHQAQHCETYYYRIRKEQPTRLTAKAARLLYLNRTCFNGLYRVNKRGEFNVPRGTRDSVFRDSDNFERVAELLQTALLFTTDFESLIDQAGRGDMVFADPPYTVRHNVNGFIKYNEILFSWADQERLAAALARARCRGAIVVATNANHESVQQLYKSHGFEFSSVSRFSSLSASGQSRRALEELVIRG